MFFLQIFHMISLCYKVFEWTFMDNFKAYLDICHSISRLNMFDTNTYYNNYFSKRLCVRSNFSVVVSFIFISYEVWGMINLHQWQCGQKLNCVTPLLKCIVNFAKFVIFIHICICHMVHGNWHSSRCLLTVIPITTESTIR